MSLPSVTVRLLRSIAIVVVLFTLALANTAIAQELSAIIGQVRDESGAILPGVTVSVTSPVLQVKQVTDVTNVQGEYRITPLPIGTYTVSYQLDGFSSMRQEGVRLDLGATVRLDITLKLGTLNETVTVSGAAPVVDVTATSASTQFTRETLELTPTSRNGAISLMVQAPGVRAPGRLDVGGGTVGDTPEFSSFGQPIESFMVMEGLVTSDSRIQTQGGNYFDYNAMEEAKVQTISNGPDVPSRGPALSMLLKSGGNEFHGGASYAYSSQHTEGDNVDDELRAQGITEGNPLLSRTDQGEISAVASSATSCGSTPAHGIGRRTSFSSVCSSQTGRRETATRPRSSPTRRSRTSCGRRANWCSGTRGCRSITTPTRRRDSRRGNPASIGSRRFGHRRGKPSGRKCGATLW